MVRNTETGQFTPKDLTGVKVGKLTVIKPVGKDKHGYMLWHCNCKCGNTIDISAQRLHRYLSGREHSARSCGCDKQKGGRPELPKGEASFNTLYGKMKRSAAARGLEWSLTEGQARNIYSGNCHYCNQKPRSYHYSSGQARTKKWGTPYHYNGIDRVDNTKGYIPSNCVPCCKVCNTAKSTLTIDEFKAWIESVYHHYCAP